MKIKILIKSILLFLIIGVFACQPATNEKTEEELEIDETIDPSLPVGIIQKIEPLRFFEMSLQANSQVIDVRTSIDFSLGKIENASNFDFSKVSFLREIGKLNKDQPLLLYDQNGSIVNDAAELLINEGFQEIYILEGGLDNWLESGKKVSK